MDVREFLGLEPTAEPMRWRLPVVPPICSGVGALFGGAALAAAVCVLETVTSRPAAWVTAQFLAYARPPAVLDVDATVLVEGNRVTQARVVLREGRQEIAAVSGAFGERPSAGEGQWAVRPDVPAPDRCPPRRLEERFRNGIAGRIETRLARARQHDELDGRAGDGSSSLWMRVPGLDGGAALLAILGDFVPLGVAQALGVPLVGNSLDNTLRVVHAPAGDGWLLADVRIDAVARGLGHGLVHLWEGDRLMATATQSAVVRLRVT